MTKGRAATSAQHARARLLMGGGAALILCAAALILGLATSSPRTQPDQIGGPFTLTADDGRMVTNRSFPGKYLAIYFGYTHCQDVCPATLNTLTAALAHMGSKAASVQPLFITVDPARDTPETLHRYVRQFSANLVGLTGTQAALQKTADEYRIISIAHGTEIDHSSVIYLVAPDGNYLAPIPADASEMVLAQAISRYVK